MLCISKKYATRERNQYDHHGLPYVLLAKNDIFRFFHIILLQLRLIYVGSDEKYKCYYQLEKFKVKWRIKMKYIAIQVSYGNVICELSSNLILYIKNVHPSKSVTSWTQDFLISLGQGKES